MEANTDKTKDIMVYFGRKELEVPQIIMQDSQIERVFEFKLIGIIFNKQLTWDGHVDHICKKASTRQYILTLMRRACYSANDIIDVYTAIVGSVLEYACVL